MNKKIKQYWQLFWKFRKMHLMRTIAYRKNFFFWLFISTIWTFINILFMDMLYDVRGGILDWNQNELLLLIGVFNIIDSFTWGFFYHNMMDYTTKIFEGSLDIYLTKPIDTQFLLMTNGNNYNNSIRMVIGVVLISIASKNLQLSFSFFQIIYFIITLIMSLLLFYFIWFIIATTAFWVEKLENINEIIPNLRRVMQMPRSLFKNTLSWIFLVFLPLGLVASIPSEVLLNKINTISIIHFTIITISFFIISRTFFNLSIKKYSGVGN